MNWALLVLFVIIAAGVIGMLILMNKVADEDATDFDKEHYTIDALRVAVKRHIEDAIAANFMEYDLPMSEIEKREKEAEALRKKKRMCHLGDPADRTGLKNDIKSILMKFEGIDEDTINKVIPFNNPDKMTVQDKFETMYAVHSRTYGTDTFRQMDQMYGFSREKTDANGYAYYEVTDEDIEAAYAQFDEKITLIDKYEVIAQRIYELEYGHDVADIFIYDSSVNDIEGGSGGMIHKHYDYRAEFSDDEGAEKVAKKEYFDVLLVRCGGRVMRLSFLSFRKESVLKNVVKKIYGNNPKFTLSALNPQVQSKLRDAGESRVMVIRPPIGNYAFWVRHPASAENKDIRKLITQQGCEYVIKAIEGAVRGGLNTLVTGNVGGGKTTLLKSMVGFFDPRYEIRTVETEPELILNDLYPDKHVYALTETENQSILDCVRMTKRLNTDVLIVGEINDDRLASAYIQSTQTGSTAGYSTMHPKSTAEGIDYLRNAAIVHGGITDPNVAELQVIKSFNIDIHQVHDAEGGYYVEYINEVVPVSYGPYSTVRDEAMMEFFERTTDRRQYVINTIIRYDKATKTYKVVGKFSERSLDTMAKNMGWEEALAINKALEEAMEADSEESSEVGKLVG